MPKVELAALKKYCNASKMLFTIDTSKVLVGKQRYGDGNEAI
jgi:hypothetical protein